MVSGQYNLSLPLYLSLFALSTSSSPCSSPPPPPPPSPSPPPPSPPFIFLIADGLIYQVKWGKAKMAIFTSTRNITYCSLFQIYETIFKELVTRMNFKMRMRKLQVKSIRAPSSVRLCLIKLGALPSSSPVCGLIRIPEMESLAKSYDITPPPVFYDLFLTSGKDPPTHIPQQEEDEEWEMGTTPVIYSDDALVVSVPLSSISIQQQLWQGTKSTHHYSPHLQPQPHPSSMLHGHASKSSMLQNLAKKISQKNHRLAAAAAASSTSITGEGTMRNCTTCGRPNPILKKRCQHCGVFFVGRRCQRCGTLNHNRSSSCLKCHGPMETGRSHHETENGEFTDIALCASMSACMYLHTVLACLHDCENM